MATTPRSSAFIAAALVGGIAVVASIFAFVPAGQASSGWRAHTGPQLVQPYFDTENDVIRFFVDGKQVAILNGSGVYPTHESGR